MTKLLHHKTLDQWTLEQLINHARRHKVTYSKKGKQLKKEALFNKLCDLEKSRRRRKSKSPRRKYRKGSPSATRKGDKDFVTHKGSKVYDRDSHYEKKSPRPYQGKRKSPKRKSPKRKSPKRKSPKRKSPKRKSPKRKSPKRKCDEKKRPAAFKCKTRGKLKQPYRSSKTGHCHWCYAKPSSS